MIAAIVQRLSRHQIRETVVSMHVLTPTTPAGEAPPETVTVRSRRVLLHVAVAAVYIGIGIVVMARFVADPNGRVSSHLAIDHTWFQWLLSHGEYSVRHLSNPLFSRQQNFPTGVNMMANTSVLGVTLPLAPVTMLFGVRATYVLWVVLACAGTAFATYWVLLRHVVRSRAAAFLAGAFAGFAPGVVHHANGQPNFVSNFLVPFIVVRSVRLGIDRRWQRDGLILGLLVTWQVFINEEVLLVTAAACAVAMLTYAALQPGKVRERIRHFTPALAVTAVTAGVLCAYPLWFQFSGPRTFTNLPIYHTWGEDLLTYLTFPRDTLFGDPATERTVGRTEQNSWFGWPLVALVLVSVLLLWRRSPVARVATIVGLVFAVMSVGPYVRVGGVTTDLKGPWIFVSEDLPVLGLFTPSRFNYAVIGVFTLVIALGWDALGPLRHRTTTPGRSGVVLGRVLIAAALFPLIPTPLPATADEKPPVFITSGAWRPYVPDGRSLVPVPPPSKWPGRDALSWAAWDQDLAVPEGYFLGPDKRGVGTHGPAKLSTLATVAKKVIVSKKVPAVTPQMRAAVLADIRRFRGSVVVLRARPANDNLRMLLEQLLGPSQQQLDVWLWRVS